MHVFGLLAASLECCKRPILYQGCSTLSVNSGHMECADKALKMRVEGNREILKIYCNLPKIPSSRYWTMLFAGVHVIFYTQFGRVVRTTVNAKTLFLCIALNVSSETINCQALQH